MFKENTREADKMSSVLLNSAAIEGLAKEAIAILLAVSIEKEIEAVLWSNDLAPTSRLSALEVFREKFVLNGGFPRGIDEHVEFLYLACEGKEKIDEDGGLKRAKKIRNELHRTVKAWLKEKTK